MSFYGTIPPVARVPVKRRGSVPALEPPAATDQSMEGRRRVAIEAVSPEVDAGRFPCKRTVGDRVAVEADVFADGHDALSCVILYRYESSGDWHEARMAPLENDRWRGEFTVTKLGRYSYTVQAWVDPFETWSRLFAKRLHAGQDVMLELEAAARMAEGAIAQVAANPNGCSSLTESSEDRREQ